MSTLTQKLSRWLGCGASQAEWHLSGLRGSVAWSLPSLFADGEANPREEYLRWQATGLPVGLQCEIVPRAQYEDWAVRSAAQPGDASSDSSLARALSAFAAETLGFESTRFVPGSPRWMPTRWWTRAMNHSKISPSTGW